MLGFFSTVTLLLGIVMIVYFFRFTTSDFSENLLALGNYQNTPILLLVGAIIAVVTGICGIIVCFKKVPIVVNIVVGFFFLIAFLLLFVNGIAIGGISATRLETLQKFCDAPTSDQGFIVK